MRPASSTFNGTTAIGRLSHYSGLYFDDFDANSAWIRDHAVLQLPPCEGVGALVIRGHVRRHPEAGGVEAGYPHLDVAVDGARAARVSLDDDASFEVRLAIPPESARRGPKVTLDLTGVGLTNALAWLGRVTGFGPWQRFRGQRRNRQLRIGSVTTEAGEAVYDFSIRLAPFSAAFARRHARLGINLAGFLTADLGIGESARCMVRAADAAQIPCALISLKLNCKNRLGDLTYQQRLQSTAPYPVNVVHLDPPASPDLDHHHGRDFRRGKYNVAYWAWELPEFPDAWLPHFAFFDEVWCPSEFVRQSIAAKSPLPVVTMPHALQFDRPTGDARARFGLPAGRFLFLSLYDLNSYSARKNPRGTIEAFRRSGAGTAGAGLVIKVQNAAANPADFAQLQADLAGVPNVTLIADTLAREEIYQLEAACDAFVSLHRSEGFGLAIAECMYLGKPVISTDWSAPAEYVSGRNGCPVKYTLTTLAENHGPYSRGQQWAEPDLDDAARWMQRLAGDRAFGAHLGRAAQATMEQHYSPAAIGARYRARLEAIATF